MCRRCRCWEPALFHARLRAPTWTHSRRDLMPSLLCLSVNTESDLSRLITATCLPIIRLHRCAQRMMRLLVVTSVSWSPCVSLCLLVTTVSSAKDVNRLRCHLGWDQGTQISPGKRQFWENCPAYCIHREYQACGWYSQSYSVDGSSDVAFCCQWCSNLRLSAHSVSLGDGIKAVSLFGGSHQL